MTYSDELKQLDEIVKRLSREGNVKNITVGTPSGYVVDISEEKYRKAFGGSQYPVTQIVNVTASAMAASSLTLSQEIRHIVQILEDFNISSKKLSEAKRRIYTLESELNKSKPSEKVIKKVMRWASDFSLELFLRLAVLVAERVMKGGGI